MDSDLITDLMDMVFGFAPSESSYLAGGLWGSEGCPLRESLIRRVDSRERCSGKTRLLLLAGFCESSGDVDGDVEGEEESGCWCVFFLFYLTVTSSCPPTGLFNHEFSTDPEKQL